MKKLKTLFLLLLITKVTIAQNYIEFYKLCNKADSLVYFKKLESAYSKYKQAYLLVDFVPREYLLKYAKLASLNDDLELCDELLQKAFKQGMKFENISFRKYRKYKNSEYYLDLKDNSKNLNSQFMTKQYYHYNYIIDSLFFIDQEVIRSTSKKSSKYNIDYSSLPDNLFSLDSTNFKTLLYYINKYGYPSESLVGLEGYEKCFYILLHNLRLPKNKSSLELLENALIKGDIKPDDYAWITDQSLSCSNQPLKFYYSESNPTKLDEKTYNEINLLRYKYGLKPIEAYGHFELGKIYAMWKKW